MKLPFFVCINSIYQIKFLSLTHNLNCMVSIFQVLIIVGIIVFAIAKQIWETAEKKQKQAKASTPNSNRPEGPVQRKSEKPQRTPFLSHDYEQNLHLSSSTNASQAIPPVEESPEPEPEFDIHSAEEVRRGIIWSEILKRKY